jgi:hypothetical protein
MRMYSCTCNQCKSTFVVGVSELQKMEYESSCPVCSSSQIDSFETNESVEVDRDIMTFEQWCEIANERESEYEKIGPGDYEKWHVDYHDYCREHGKSYEIR